jgi:hypothetical protein
MIRKLIGPELFFFGCRQETKPEIGLTGSRERARFPEENRKHKIRFLGAWKTIGDRFSIL